MLIKLILPGLLLAWFLLYWLQLHLNKSAFTLKSVVKYIHTSEDILLLILLLAMIILAVGQIVLRNVLNESWSWVDPLVKNDVLWIGLLGSLVAVRNNQHIALDVFSPFLPQKVMNLIKIFLSYVAAALCALMAWTGYQLASISYDYSEIAFANIPAWTLQAPIFVAFLLMAFRFIVQATTKLVSRKST